MQSPLKLVLAVVGIILIGYGLYTAFSPQTVIDAGPIQVSAKSDSISTQNIVIIGLGVLSLLGAMFYKKK